MPIEKSKSGGIIYPKAGFRATCTKCSGWKGPNQPTREKAERDYRAHMMAGLNLNVGGFGGVSTTSPASYGNGWLHR